MDIFGAFEVNCTAYLRRYFRTTMSTKYCFFVEIFKYIYQLIFETLRFEIINE